MVVRVKQAPINFRYPHQCPVCGEKNSAYIGAVPASLECLNGCRYGAPRGKAP